MSSLHLEEMFASNFNKIGLIYDWKLTKYWQHMVILKPINTRIIQLMPSWSIQFHQTPFG